MISCKSAARIALFLTFLVSLMGTTMLHAAPWVPLGPDGGDARRFASDPHDPTHLYLGTANGWLYESHNSGASWQRQSRPGKRDDLVIDGIFIDPTDSKHIVLGAWVLGYKDGGVYTTTDAGSTWTSQPEMQGQAVLSLAVAASDSKTLVIGTLKGIYRSNDGGQSWKPISPTDSTEIHNVQSVAIDPKDPNIIYAGTWHLPWKTLDGGTTWSSIKEGLIVDSDVFSIIIDPKTPQVVYASACSGIYKSDTAGAQFHKVQGIPTTARRTRVLLQDPENLTTVFAGTTEGLYRTVDAGKDWIRMTDAAVIVNDVLVDHRDSKHVMLATDRGGILSSNDGGETFHSSNDGFSARQVTALKRDSKRPETLFAGVVNDKELGGVFESDNGGTSWMQRSSGLEGRDIFSLGQAADGTMIAGTSHGIYRLSSDGSGWSRAAVAPIPVTLDTASMNAATGVRPPIAVARNQFKKDTGSKGSTVVSPQHKLSAQEKTTESKSNAAAQRPEAASASVAKHVPASARAGKWKRAGVPAPIPTIAFDGNVSALATADTALLAATSNGLLTSADNGANWVSSGTAGSADWRYLAAAKGNVVSATLHSIQFSSDSGVTWATVKMPAELTHINSVAVEPTGEIWVGGREGVYFTSNAGNDWTTPTNLFVNQVSGLFWDEATNRILVAARGANKIAFFVQLPAKTVSYVDTGWDLRFIRPVGDHLVGVTFFDGVVIQPAGSAAPQRASR